MTVIADTNPPKAEVVTGDGVRHAARAAPNVAAKENGAIWFIRCMQTWIVEHVVYFWQSIPLNAK